MSNNLNPEENKIIDEETETEEEKIKNGKIDDKNKINKKLKKSKKK